MQPDLSAPKLPLANLWEAIRHGGRLANFVLAGLVLMLTAALSTEIIRGSNDRSEMQAITAANKSLRNTLGELTAAIAEKDREMDRLEEAACRAATPPPQTKRAAWR